MLEILMSLLPFTPIISIWLVSFNTLPELLSLFLSADTSLLELLEFLVGHRTDLGCEGHTALERALGVSCPSGLGRIIEGSGLGDDNIFSPAFRVQYISDHKSPPWKKWENLSYLNSIIPI